MRFQFFDHTADIGVRGFGETEEEAFANTAFGMFSILSDLSNVKKMEKIEVSVKGVDREEQLVNMLSELLFWHTVKGYLFCEFEVSLEKNGVKVNCFGEKIGEKHEIKGEIKTVTYHQLKIEKREKRWQTQVIFDV
jgi:SHS2 domain-containing protein